MVVTIEHAIAAAIRAGGLYTYRLQLEEGEWEERMLWIRKEIASLLHGSTLPVAQLQIVKAALRRYLTGGPFTVITAKCQHREVETVGDFRELKGISPPFVELRFKPPKHALRMFGRFIGKDKLVLTSYGMKSFGDNTGHKRTDIREERRRCDDFFKLSGFPMSWVPATIEESISKSEFV